MEHPFPQEMIHDFNLFISTLKSNPDLIHEPEFVHLRNFIISFGGVIQKPENVHSSKEDGLSGSESESETELELDMSGVLEPDNVEFQIMGDLINRYVPEEHFNTSEEYRKYGMIEFEKGNYEKAIEYYTDSIRLNSQLPLTYWKRGQAFLKLNKPRACLKDCNRAIFLNSSSAPAYKFRGRAFRLLGDFESAHKDLTIACLIHSDEEGEDWLKEVTPNFLKIDEYNKRKEQKRIDKLHKKRDIAKKPECPFAKTGIPPFIEKVAADPVLQKALEDPEVAKAVSEIGETPVHFLKYKNCQKIKAIFKRLQEKYSWPNEDNLPDICSKYANSVPPSKSTENDPIKIQQN